MARLNLLRPANFNFCLCYKYCSKKAQSASTGTKHPTSSCFEKCPPRTCNILTAMLVGFSGRDSILFIDLAEYIIAAGAAGKLARGGNIGSNNKGQNDQNFKKGSVVSQWILARSSRYLITHAYEFPESGKGGDGVKGTGGDIGSGNKGSNTQTFGGKLSRLSFLWIFLLILIFQLAAAGAGSRKAPGGSIGSGNGWSIPRLEPSSIGWSLSVIITHEYIVIWSFTH